MVLSGHTESKTPLWDIAERRRIGDLPLDQSFSSIQAIANHEGTTLAAVCTTLPRNEHNRESSYVVEFWDLSRQKRIGPSLPSPVKHPRIELGELDGDVLAIVSDAATLTMWKVTLESWSLLSTAGINEQSATPLIVAIGCWHGRTVLITTSRSNESEHELIEVWKPRGRKPVLTIDTGRTEIIFGIALAHVDQHTLALTAGDDSVVRAWNLDTGLQFGRDFEGHSGTICHLTVGSVDGRPTAITGCADQTVRLWDVHTQECIDVLPMPDTIGSLAFGADGLLVVGIGPDFVVLDAPGLTPPPPH